MTSKNRKTIRLSDIIIPKYQPLVNDREHMHQILTSGRAGTKSSAMAIISDFLLVSEPNSAAVIMRKHHNKLRKTVYKECIRAIGRLGLNKKKHFDITKSPMQITYKKNGNTLYFTGSDSIDDTKGMIDEERKIRLVVLDELTEFFDKGEGEDEITNIVATFVRGNDTDFRMMYLFNPPKNPKAPINIWVQKMAAREDCIHIHSDYRDVPVSWLGQKLIDEAEAMKAADIKMYNWVWLGLATGLDDVIYYMFDEDKHVVQELPKTKYSFYIVGADYGQMNATTFQFYGLDLIKIKMQGLDEYYYSGREEKRQRSPSEYAQDFKEKLQQLYFDLGRKPVYVCIDPSAKGLAEEIKRVCPECIFPNVDNTVDLGITRVKKLLMFNVLNFIYRQVHQIEEMYLYEYDPKAVERGKDDPLKINDHCCDATRYAVMFAWKYLCNLLPILKADEKE